MNFSALASAWLFALLVPLIIFYFLKLKRPRQTVSSLVLWRQVLSDQRVNSPFQRFKRNLLLLLQILLLCALTLGAMQPYWPATGGRAQFIPILIDCSASMAYDENGGRNVTPIRPVIHRRWKAGPQPARRRSSPHPSRRDASRAESRCSGG